MYCQYYSFTERPFSLLPDPAFLYLGKKHQSALSMLLYSLNNQAGFCVLSGEIGAGKTTLIRELLDEIDESVTVGLVNNYSPTASDLLTNVLSAFGIESTEAKDDATRHQIFSDFLIEQYANNRRTLLIFDEAQHLSIEVLESLRMLSNINADKDMLLQVMLVGQNELRERLRQPELAQFAQRIVIDFHLQPLDQQETIEYIRHRVEVVGGNPEIFTRLACISIFAATNGIPRLINLLCDTALVYGYAEAESQHVSKEIINQVIRDRQGGSLLPLFETGDSSEEKTRLDEDATEEFILDSQKTNDNESPRAPGEWLNEEQNSREPQIPDTQVDAVTEPMEAFTAVDVEPLDEINVRPVSPEVETVPMERIEVSADTDTLPPPHLNAETLSEELSEEVRHRRQEQIAQLHAENDSDEIVLESGVDKTPFQVRDSDAASPAATVIVPPPVIAEKQASIFPAILLAFTGGVVAFMLVSFNVTGEWLWETSMASESLFEQLKNRFSI
ncbi:MAG: AAA family ATPase [Gammaproteobacteria bacterium]